MLMCWYLSASRSPSTRWASGNVAADAMGLTAVPGVWVVGNVADLTAWVIGAAAAGARAGAAINADLIAEETRQAVSAYREQRSAASQLVAA